VDAETSPLLVYDGDCAFCSSCARWLISHWSGPERAVAWQHLTADELAGFGLGLDDVRRFVWWIDPATGPARGHLAIARAMRAAGGWPSIVGRGLSVPPISWAAAAAYPLIARWRHRLPGGTPACRL